MSDVQKMIEKAKRDIKIARWVNAVLWAISLFMTPLSWLDVVRDSSNYWNWFWAVYFTLLVLRLNKARR